MSKQVIRNLCSEENHFKAKINGINVVTTVVIDSKKEERSGIYLNFSRKKPSMKESTLKKVAARIVARRPYLLRNK